MINIGEMMKDIFRKMDKPLFFLMLLFCTFGLIMVFSSSSVSAILRYKTTSMHFFTNQLIFITLSFIAGFIALRVPTSKYNHLSWLLMFGIDIALFLLLVYGSITNHVQSWFYIAGFSIQPSEFAKSFIIIFIACFYKDKLFNSDQLERLNFKEPCTRYMEQTGYQVCNGFIAINNGGLLGVGLGNSTQKYLYLPESHTDFIFAIIVEELGVVTGIIVVLMYALLVLRILYIAKRASNLRNSIIAYGTMWYILLHVIINLCGVLGVFPLTGVPLPLLSYGGSHTINILVMLFLVLRVSVENKTAIYKEEMKKLSN